MFTRLDHQYMARALQLAEQGLYTTDPNPRVGCVLVRDGEIVGEGFHARAGEPHAERHAMAEAGDRAHGATAYVTLEPCSHTGRTGPCADALVAAGVARVVVAMEDPNPQVAGNGMQTLAAAGIETASGLLEADARALNPGFISRMTRQRPYLRIKIAASVDGRTAMASGESQWITGPAAREDVQRLRARSSAVITGVGTVLADRPSYTVRPQQWALTDYQQHSGGSDRVRQPLRVILDRTLQTPPGVPVVSAPGHCLLVAGEQHPGRQNALESAGAEVMLLPASGSGIDLQQLLIELNRRECNEVLVECGATLAGAFVREGLFDELIVYMAPALLGSSARPLLGLPQLASMSEKVSLQWQDVRQVGNDLRLTLVPA
ncbi:MULTISPECIES: bifunctional diaminohydroxyphosphoribosylaminopyrimidine deaminase/5-amino-6-(5-phosphoribosylamino)uracil reductase RibD [Alcanivorax]|jgi:diaminohydroxyphosphoribosylaminopyrimidine deaminase/5-amino-6-(5-phosphoribosylamino)uracil reductase|uniref:bifunctional diaminohydroxyphosphoribosylaminopyrimidine deaminase/5-amino-6-(5-phosphoribosylamino)uracil reductase RibD n=1 Tax=Alcanivorax TaxID=59753 RepID=UPI000C472358|nr:bifunctional diaminohydroxyphosphoribosylaminopyrimidine deaminase/5-amino-6-(5-phosphoribosylamino)uracil reductase RibD [Alcanivorax jadensis]MBG32840.1 riboflavin biosynthesis protein RibD [Alcanivorax sp.]MDF1636281.1 bifunctional diaminohydroxyphosphoribosylaminopyrimidine deaminase/5-amino-6-(5-phosphoribosylamino)uracil reductase RibD [Alcanivorax jadensis]|tara:strand:+ start:5111 stop:6241 length:1131 start_codon:yes stop_codon:yes gene_type:complete